MVRPAESCWFDYYLKKTHKIIPYNETKAYETDELGLKNLQENGKLIKVEVDCEHTEYPEDPKVFGKIVEFLSISHL